ncbi:MAG: hypothetical protein V4662_13135 [Verrucomicrobiota bacterium]
MTRRRCSRWVLLTFGILASAFVIPAARAHPSDISYLKVKVKRQRVEMRFTFNLLNLTRFAPGIDTNNDRQIDKPEIESARTAVLDYLNKHIQVQVNEKEATLGTAGFFECVWPAVEGKYVAAEADYPVRYVDFVFTQEAKPVLADVWLGFDIWQQTGPLGSIEATYAQDDLMTQVPFTMGEPDYLYDTGYAVEDIFQEPKRPAPPSEVALPDWLIPAGAALALLLIIGTVIIFIVRPRKA